VEGLQESSVFGAQYLFWEEGQGVGLEENILRLMEKGMY